MRNGFTCKMYVSKPSHFLSPSDGELDEGSNWESFLFAAHFKLSNLVIVIGYRSFSQLVQLKILLAGHCWISLPFNLHVLESDGHNHESLRLCFYNCSVNTSSPKIIICHTVKGKGVSFMENNVLWHYRNAQGDEYEAAISQLNPTR